MYANALAVQQTKNALLPVDEIFEWACRYADEMDGRTPWIDDVIDHRSVDQEARLSST
jgi:hypothetical protein